MKAIPIDTKVTAGPLTFHCKANPRSHISKAGGHEFTPVSSASGILPIVDSDSTSSGDFSYKHGEDYCLLLNTLRSETSETSSSSTEFGSEISCHSPFPLQDILECPTSWF